MVVLTAMSIFLSSRNLEKRLVDHLPSLLQRREADALVVAVHPAQVVGVDGIGVDAVDGDAARAPGDGVGAGLKKIRGNEGAGERGVSLLDEGAVEIRVQGGRFHLAGLL